MINSIHPYLTYQTAAFAPKVPEQETTIQVLQKMDTVLLSRSTRDEGLTRLSRGSDDVGDISIVRKVCDFIFPRLAKAILIPYTVNLEFNLVAIQGNPYDHSFANYL